MAVLQALSPLIVDFDGLGQHSDEEGARLWVWRRLQQSGRSGVSEAVRVFEIVPRGNTSGETVLGTRCLYRTSPLSSARIESDRRERSFCAHFILDA